MTGTSLPTRTLAAHPDLEQLKRQARELLDAYRAGEAAAVTEVDHHYQDARARVLALHDAQLVIARAYGFGSWPRLKAYVDGVTLRRLDEAVRAGDIEQVRAMVRARPELAAMEIDNHGLLHHAVLGRTPDIVRELMDHGADARRGLYPHAEATSPLALAMARGDREIEAIIRDRERRRRGHETDGAIDEAQAMVRVILAGDDPEARRRLDRNPELIHAATGDGWTALHAAAFAWRADLVGWLLARGADPNRAGPRGLTPLDAAATSTGRDAGAPRPAFATVMTGLRNGGAAMTARAAVALGDVAWIRTHLAAGGLPGPIDAIGGLLRIAVTHDRAEILTLLLEHGVDPDERVRVPGVDEVDYSWGFPLWECAATGKYDLAEILLAHGADPNAQVYASGSPVSQAFGQHDERMIALLTRHGGVVDLHTAAVHRQTALAERMFAAASDRQHVAERLLGAAACGGEPALVRLALEHVTWPHDDARWFGVLEQPLRLWNHGPGHWCRHDWDRTTYLACFRLVLARCDPDVRGREPDRGLFALTILHAIAGSRDHVTADERLAFATAALDAGARLDVRDGVLASTPLGWACRWGRRELVTLFLARGADPIEASAEPWATPMAWARRHGHPAIEAELMRAW